MPLPPPRSTRSTPPASTPPGKESVEEKESRVNTLVAAALGKPRDIEIQGDGSPRVVACKSHAVSFTVPAGCAETGAGQRLRARVYRDNSRTCVVFISDPTRQSGWSRLPEFLWSQGISFRMKPEGTGKPERVLDWAECFREMVRIKAMAAAPTPDRAPTWAEFFLMIEKRVILCKFEKPSVLERAEAPYLNRVKPGLERSLQMLTEIDRPWWLRRWSPLSWFLRRELATT